MEQDFSNREINAMFHELIERATRIETQTTLTNGRVTKLELINSNKEGALSMARYISLFLATVLLGYLGWLGHQVADIHKTLSVYDVNIEP